MMISPDSDVDKLKDLSYLELIKERDILIDSIQDFEIMEKWDDRSEEEWRMHPTPEVQYQVHLEYLSKLCSYMHERYNEKFVSKGKKLSDLNEWLNKG